MAVDRLGAELEAEPRSSPGSIALLCDEPKPQHRGTALDGLFCACGQATEGHRGVLTLPPSNK